MDIYIELNYEYKNIILTRYLIPLSIFLDKAEKIVILKTEYIKGQGKY